MDTGERILSYLNANGIRQSFVAEKCGWTKQKVHSMLHGRNRITADDYYKICNALCVSMDFFYEAAQEKAKPSDIS